MDFDTEGPMALPLWINGHAYLTVCDTFFDVTQPQTGAVLRRVPLAGADEAATAVAAAMAAQAAWAAMPMPARRVCLSDLAAQLLQYRAHIAALLAEETGLSLPEAETEVEAAAAALQADQVGESGVQAIVLDTVQPLWHAAAALAPAALAGATLVFKPSPRAPAAIFVLCELTARAGWPAGVVNLLQGDLAALEGLCATEIDTLCYAGAGGLAESIAALCQAQGKSWRYLARSTASEAAI